MHLKNVQVHQRTETIQVGGHLDFLHFSMVLDIHLTTILQDTALEEGMIVTEDTIMEEELILQGTEVGKANSFEDAYKKVEKQKKTYGEPYLNPYGELVRWKIESLDDCFWTYIKSFADLNNPEGIEVFSSLKKRKLTAKRHWDGK